MRAGNEPGPPDRPHPEAELPLHLQQTQAGADAGAGDPQLVGAPPIPIEGYSDLRELHRGGQGIVYRALQESTRRTVAIKVLREGAHADSAARKRFQREVQIAAQLDHPHIVKVFDSGVTAAGHPYFVMEYVHGAEFDRYVRAHELALQDTLRLHRTVLEAVHYAHARGVIHRDLKPSNILVDEHGQPKLVDFGLARPLIPSSDSFASLTGQVLGTMAYMSPEQVRADPEEIDARTDVYALGIILYELLTGTSPYPASTQIVEILRHITETSPRPPTRTWDSSTGIARRSGRRSESHRCPIDAELETIMLEAIAKEPARRYPSAHDFAADIGRYLEGQPIQARRDSGIYVLRKKLARNRRHLLLGLAVLVVVGAVWMLAPRSRPAPARTLDPETIARYTVAETELLRQRDELMHAVESRAAAGESPLDPLTRESLRIVQEASAQLRDALAKDPANPDLRELMLKTYEREVALLRKIVALPAASG
jgi:serine/threonine protein kinase